MSDAEERAETAVDLEAWAEGHGFAPSDRAFSGETPFLRLGVAEISGATFEGRVAGHAALLGEFSIASGDSGFGISPGTADFIVLLCEIDAPYWPRITIHPLEFSDGDWLTHLLHREDHRVRDLAPDLNRRYRLRAANEISNDELVELLTPELVTWILEQPEMVLDVENNAETGDSLVIAVRAGEDEPDPDPDALIGRAEHLIPLLESH